MILSALSPYTHGNQTKQTNISFVVIVFSIESKAKRKGIFIFRSLKRDLMFGNFDSEKSPNFSEMITNLRLVPEVSVCLCVYDDENSSQMMRIASIFRRLHDFIAK